MIRRNFQRILSLIAALAVLCSLPVIGGSLTANADDKDITLRLRAVSNGGVTLYIDPVANVENRYYKMAITVDGVPRDVSIKLNAADADYFVISPYSFNRYDSSLSTAPTSSFEIAAGTQLIPMGVGDPFTAHPEADTVTVSRALKVVNTSGIWAEEEVSGPKQYTDIPASGMSFHAVAATQAGETVGFYLNAGMDVPKANGSSYWGDYAGTFAALVDGEEVTASFGGAGSATRFLFRVAGADTAETVVIPDGTCVDLQNGDPGLRIVGDFKMYKDGDTWLLGEKPEPKTYTDIPASGMSFHAVAATQAGETVGFYLNAGMDVPKANGSSYWGDYAGTFAALVDGEEVTASFGGAGSATRFLFRVAGADTAETVVIPDGTCVDLQNGDPGIRIVGDFKMYKAGDAWFVGEKPVPVAYTEIPADMLTYYETQENYFSLNVSTIGLPQANGSSYWGTYAGEITVLVNGEEVTATVGNGGKDSRLFLYLAADVVAAAETMVIPDGSQVDRTNGDAGIRFVGDFKMYKAAGHWYEGEQPKVTYTDIDASKLTIHANGTGYNAENGQSYIYLTLPVELPVSANYSIFAANAGLTVTATDAEGNEVPVTGAYFSSIEAEKNTTMLLYLQTGTDWFADYNKIVVKAQSGLVNQKDPTTGINLVGDLELIRHETLGWGVGEQKTPDTYREVGVSFASATGAELKLNAILPDGKKIMDIYGDWSTALGAITVGSYDDNGEIVETVIPSTRYSMAGGYFILYGLDLNNIETITVKAGTYLVPTANCKSDVPLKIVNTLKLVRNEEDEFVTADAGKPSFGTSDSSPVTGETGHAPWAAAVLVLAVAALIAVHGNSVVDARKPR